MKWCEMQEPLFYSSQVLFLKNSHFSSFFIKCWACKYDVWDIFNNDFDALVSRIKFVQQREPSSMFSGF